MDIGPTSDWVDLLSGKELISLFNPCSAVNIIPADAPVQCRQGICKYNIDPTVIISHYLIKNAAQN